MPEFHVFTREYYIDVYQWQLRINLTEYDIHEINASLLHKNQNTVKQNKILCYVVNPTTHPPLYMSLVRSNETKWLNHISKENNTYYVSGENSELKWT